MDKKRPIQSNHHSPLKICVLSALPFGGIVGVIYGFQAGGIGGAVAGLLAGLAGGVGMGILLGWLLVGMVDRLSLVAIVVIFGSILLLLWHLADFVHDRKERSYLQIVKEGEDLDKGRKFYQFMFSE